ncbi:hypothetical protein [Acinetobacter baumannii]|uniref:hypothetical protein n=1 Tax=Acinetobacter baumannii TaxID=470 RepID=UPI003F4B8533
MADLKRLVESIDLVESWGGIEDLKLYDLSHCKDKPESAGYKLLKAIAITNQYTEAGMNSIWFTLFFCLCCFIWGFAYSYGSWIEKSN